jgi:hypothetical protein
LDRKIIVNTQSVGYKAKAFEARNLVIFVLVGLWRFSREEL